MNTSTSGRMKAVLFALVLVMATATSAGKVLALENYEVEWKKSFGGGYTDSFRGITIAGDGGYVAVGSSRSTDQDMSGLHKVAANNDNDATIVKYSRTGDVEWKKTFGGNSHESFSDVTTTGDGGYVAVGASSSTDQDMAGLSKVGSDAIIVKYDAEGEVEWKKSFGGVNGDSFDSVIVVNDGGYIAVGNSSSGSDDMLGLKKGGITDAIIVKYDVDGEVEWKKSFGGNGDQDGYVGAVATDDGGCVAIGTFNSSDQDMAGISKGGLDAVIVKYSSHGDIEWKNSFGGSSMDSFGGIVVTEDGGYVVAGGSNSTDQDLTGLNKGGTDAIIVKYDTGGEVEWKKSFGGSSTDDFSGIVVTEDGGYVVAGGSNSTDQDLTGLNKGGHDAIIVKYDAEGEVEWKKSFGGGNTDYFYGIVVDGGGGFAAVGTSASADQDMTGLHKIQVNSNEDAIIVKYLDMSEPVGTVTSDAEGTECFIVTVTLKTNVPIETPGGWVKANSRTFTKAYSENTSEEVALVGLNGLNGTILVVVDSIVCSPGEQPKPPTSKSNLKTPDTGMSLVFGLVTLGEVLFVVVGLAVFFRMREA